MATTNIQSFAGDVEVSGELTVTGQLNSTTGSDKVKLTATTASETDYIPLSKGTTGAQPLYTDSNLTYNPANNVLAANLSGSVSGNVTGNVSGNVTGNVSGNAAFATNATYATNAGQLDGSTKSTDANANSICQRNSAADINCRLVRPNYADQSNINGAMAFRTNNTSDNYIRFCSSTSAIRTYLQVPTRQGGDATGTWSINVNGSAANATYANSAGFATNATHANNANTVAFTDRDANSETDYIAFVSSHSAGDKALYTDSNLTYNPANNVLAANLSGNVSGNVTGNVSGNVTGNVSGNAAFATNATYANQAGYVSGGVCKYLIHTTTTQRQYPYSTNIHLYDLDFNYAAERSNSTLIIHYSIFCESPHNRNFVTTVNGSYYPFNMSNIRYGVATAFWDADFDSTPSQTCFTVHYSPGTTANRIYRVYSRSVQNTSQTFELNRCWNAGRGDAEFGISYVTCLEFAV
jgi:hypothetical protein